MPHHSISIIIPAYNEMDGIVRQIREILQIDPAMEVVVADDGSADDTARNSLSAGGRVISHPYNIGNGAAVKTGIRAAGGDILVFMDGDGQHDPADIPRLLAHLDRHDMVVGARTAAQHASLPRGMMNRVFDRLASYVTGFHIQDLTSGFRAMRAQTARDLLPLLPNGYSWPTTSTLVLLRSGMSVKYVPINARSRRHGRSRIRPVRDGVRFILIILKICTLYAPFKIFLPVSAGMFLLGLMNYAYTYFSEGRFTNMSALMFTTSVVIFMMGLVSEQISQIGMLRYQFRYQAPRSASTEEARNSDEHRN